eukprot:824978_1
MTRNILFSFPDGDGIREGRVIYTAALRENDSLADGLSSLSMVQLNDLKFFHEARAVDPFLSAHAQGIPDRSEVLAVKHVQNVPDQNEFSMSVDPVYLTFLEASKKKSSAKKSAKKQKKATPAKKKPAGAVAKKQAEKSTNLTDKKKAAVKAIVAHKKAKNAKSVKKPDTSTKTTTPALSAKAQ